jgi:hypothetical protein
MAAMKGHATRTGIHWSEWTVGEIGNMEQFLSEFHFRT